MSEYSITGTAASQGIAIGPALVYIPPLWTYGTYRPTPDETPYRQGTSAHVEIKHLYDAIATADSTMAETEVHLRAEGKTAEAHIFEAHRNLLKKPSLRKHAVTLISKAGWRAAEAIVEAGEHEISPFADTNDPYLKAYIADVRDVVIQIRRVLEQDRTLTDRLTHAAIVVAHDLGLSEWLTIARERLLGLVLASSGPTAHSLIMARSLGIPAVINIGYEGMKQLFDGMTLAIDGSSGEVIVSPGEATINRMRTHAKDMMEQQATLRRQRDQPSITRDGHHVILLANASTVVEAQNAREWGAVGIGSLRSELLFLGRPDLPDEEEQLALYNTVAAELPGLPIVARTLDIGGDKYLPSFPLPKESNPFLGWRGIRIGLSHPETILLPQLRAMLRAAACNNIRIVIPMIATIDEFRQVRGFLQRAHQELIAEDIPCPPNPQLGVMIEIPAAALAADVIASEADFISIGSNDLIQYTLACDRTNQRVGYLNQPLEPAVLHLMHRTIEAAHRYNRTVSLCGEMASDPRLTPLLIGMGIDELSCTPVSLPLVRSAVRATSRAEAQQLAQAVLQATSLEEVQELVLK